MGSHFLKTKFLQSISKGWCVALLALTCCSEGDELSLGIGTPDGVHAIDTVSIKSSTIKLDSMVTSGQGLQLVGAYSDQYLGNLESQSYFQVGISNVFPSDQQNVYDSMALVLHYQGYWYGDTSKTFKLNLSRVTQDFEPYEGTQFYNSSELRTGPEIWAELSFKPRPVTQDSIVIPVSDVLGALFFDRLMQDNSQTDFLTSFPGFKLSVSEAASVLGFQVSAETCYFELYYHQQSELVETGSYRFGLVNDSNQFNGISNDFQVTSLENLDISQLPSTADDNNATYVQAGTGIITKLEFPYLPELIKNNDVFLLEASLLIRPQADHSDPATPYPDQLILSETNQFNDFGPQLTTDFGLDPQVANLQSDPEFGEHTFYRFAMTEYLENQLYEDGGSYGLLVTLPLTVYSQSVHKLSIGSNDNREYTTELIINYLYTP